MSDETPSKSSHSSDSEPAVSLEAIPLHSTNLLTVLDPTGIIQYESPSIERIFGYEQDALVGEQVAEYFHPDDREDVIAAFQRVVVSEEDVVEAVEYRHKRADGTYRWVESVAAADPTPNGNYVVNTCDISDQKQRERQLKETNERLDEFASIVSHELRNPLHIAQGRISLARDEMKNTEHMDVAATAIERSQNLLDDLLTLAREGETARDEESLPLRTVVEQCWETCEVSGATLEVEGDTTIYADRGRLQQLLENLIRNAVEHGGENVTVTVGEMDDGFYVADDGPGIPDADVDDVFEAGYSTSVDGTGFGLNIVREIATAHGWTIQVINGETDGARFEITGIESD